MSRDGNRYGEHDKTFERFDRKKKPRPGSIKRREKEKPWKRRDNDFQRRK